MRVRGAVLDMDGTLLDSMGIWHEIDVRYFAENHVPIPEGLSERVNKMTMEEWSAYFYYDLGLGSSPQDVSRRIDEMARDYYFYSLPLKPGALDFLDFLDGEGIGYGVATATYRNSAERALERLGVRSRLRFLLTPETFPAGKSTPAMFLAGAERLGTLPRETLVVEDSLHCVRAAREGGFLTAGVYDKTCPDAEWAEIVRIADFAAEDLASLQRRLALR